MKGRIVRGAQAWTLITDSDLTLCMCGSLGCVCVRKRRVLVCVSASIDVRVCFGVCARFSFGLSRKESQW